MPAIDEERRKLIFTYSMEPEYRRALELTSLNLRCTKNQILDFALWEFIENHFEESEKKDILGKAKKPINILKKKRLRLKSEGIQE